MEYGKKVRIGGFNVLKYKRDEMSLMKVSTIMGNWSMEYREDSVVYHCLDMELSDEEKEAVHVMFVNAFTVSNFLDADLQHAVILAGDELQKRIVESAEEVSEEENQKILDEERISHEMMEEMEALKNDK